VAVIFRDAQGDYIYVSEGFFERVVVFSLAISSLTFILMQSELARRSEVILRNVIHFILINVVIWGAFYSFGWDSFIAPFIVLTIFVIVYTIARIILYKQSQTFVDQLNKRINEIRNSESATHIE